MTSIKVGVSSLVPSTCHCCHVSSLAGKITRCIRWPLSKGIKIKSQQHGSQSKSLQCSLYISRLEKMDVYKAQFTTDVVIILNYTYSMTTLKQKSVLHHKLIAIQTLLYIIIFCYTNSLINLICIVFYLQYLLPALERGTVLKFYHMHTGNEAELKMVKCI